MAARWPNDGIGRCCSPCRTLPREHTQRIEHSLPRSYANPPAAARRKAGETEEARRAFEKLRADFPAPGLTASLRGGWPQSRLHEQCYLEQNAILSFAGSDLRA